ncbi:MAG TPA: hypothetical protein VLA49_01075 [Anaerolineales bacterium]|nr:hypothetical protein [Anaerolineales bacterium]
MEFPGKNRIQDPVLDLYYEIEIEANPEQIWPWLKQMGYHRGGWYIDTGWDKAIQEHFWPRLVPPEARGTYKPPAIEILPEYQTLDRGDIVPDGPPGSAYYEVVDVQENQLLLLYATSHFNYMAPPFVYKTRFAPRGSFCWAFILEKINESSTRLISWWQAEAQPRSIFLVVNPLIKLIDRLHQREILKGIKRRVEKSIG